MNVILIGDMVKFQRPDTDSCCDAAVAWIAGDVKFLHVPRLADGQSTWFDIEVAQERDDGIFTRADNFTLEPMDEDVLRALRESAAAINHT